MIFTFLNLFSTQTAWTQRSSTFLSPSTGFLEDNFSLDGVEVGGGGSCLLLKLGKNSMGSNSVSQWKMFRFLNVVWQTGRCPALAPQTTHTHLCTLFPPFPVGGWGWLPPLSNTCRTKTRWVHGCRPARVIPVCLGSERVPGPRFRPQRLGGPQRKEIGLRTSLVSVHLHVKQFSHTMEGVV